MTPSFIQCVALGQGLSLKLLICRRDGSEKLDNTYEEKHFLVLWRLLAVFSLWFQCGTPWLCSLVSWDGYLKSWQPCALLARSISAMFLIFCLSRWVAEVHLMIAIWFFNSATCPSLSRFAWARSMFPFARSFLTCSRMDKQSVSCI